MMTWLGLALLAVPVFLLVVICERIENPRSRFATYDEARASGIMDRGWIPDYIPRSSHDIREQHDIDTNRVKMTFKYDPQDTCDVSSHCVRSEAIPNGRRYFCEYFGSSVQIDLYIDGTATLSSRRQDGT